MIKKICKLFYRMGMFYLIINKNQLFISKGGPGGGGSIYMYICMSYNIFTCYIYTLPETNGSETTFLFGFRPVFRGDVSFREGILI